MEGPRYTIRVAAAKTRLSPHTIRAWERRYNALEPNRSETNRRLYSEEDVHRLTQLRRATENGYGIGQVAKLPLEEIERLAAAEPLSGHRKVRHEHEGPIDLLAECEYAVEGYDPDGLEFVLVRGAALLGVPDLLQTVVIPLLELVGRRWEEGTLQVAQEHMASAVLRTHLESIRKALHPVGPVPRIIVTTPAGQLHELGALLASIRAAAEGWAVTYLGPNLPADQIALAARQSKAYAVALSLVFPRDDKGVVDELRRLRLLVGPSMPILAGGRAAGGYATVLGEIGARVIPDLDAFREQLHEIRGSLLGAD